MSKGESQDQVPKMLKNGSYSKDGKHVRKQEQETAGWRGKEADI